MDRRRSLVAGGFVSFIVATSLTLGVAAPAQAIDVPGAWNLWEYVQTIKGQQLARSNGSTAMQNWGGQTGRAAAKSANLSAAGTVYGTLARDAMAEVIPIDKPVDAALGKKLTVRGTGIKIPVTSLKNFTKVTPGGVGGLTTAATAYAFRGEISNGLLSFVGISAENEVCSTPKGPGTPMLNFLTGQDCAAYDATQEFIDQANSDATVGVTAGQTCAGPTCATLFAAGPVLIGANPSFMIAMHVTGYNDPSGSFPPLPVGILWYKTPGVQDGGWHGRYSPTFPGTDTAGTECARMTGAAPGDQSVVCAWAWVSDGALAAAPSAYFMKGSYGMVDAAEPGVPVKETEGDPERWFECVISGSDGVDYTGSSSVFHEGDSFPQPVCAQLPQGVYPLNTRIQEVGGAETHEFWDMPSDPEYLDYQRDYGAMCEAKTCLLDLKQNSSGLSCFGLGATCDGWMTSPTRDTDYSCSYGGKAEPVQECYVYANVFNESKRNAGNAYADPETGEDLGSGTSLRPDEQLMSGKPRAPESTRSCGGGGTDGAVLSPITFVLRPLMCAAEWAFIPSTAAVAKMVSSLDKSWKETAPGEVMAVVSGWRFNFHGSGCGGVPWDVQYGSAHVNLGIPSACAGTRYADTARVVNLIGSVGMVLGSAFAIRRFAGAAIDYNPGS